MSLKSISYIRPKLYPKQFDAIYDERRYSVIEATTKAGKTSGCISWLLEQAISGGHGQNHWWVAPVSSQADIAFRRMRLALPPQYVTPSARKTLTLPNSAVIWFKSGDNEDSLYGEDVYSAVIDEASRFKEGSWHAVRSTLTKTRGRLRVIGNVKGRRNWFYQMARRAEAGARDMGYHKLTANDAVEAGVLDSEEIRDAKANLPDAVFRELYMAEPSDDQGNPFGIKAIDACLRSGLSTGDPIFWGWDLARTQDWTVGIALDKTGAVCRFERFQHVPWDRVTSTIVQLVGKTPALIDSTGVGDPITEAVQRTCQNVQGFKFTSGSKQQLMEGLTLAIHKGAVSFPEGPIPVELRQFEYVFTRTGVRYSAPEGLHDDCVCALALAVMCGADRFKKPVYDTSLSWVS